MTTGVNETFSVTSHPRPSTMTNFVGTFGTAEAEGAAVNLTRFMELEKADRWVPFTKEQLIQFYSDNEYPLEEMLYGLTGSYVHNGEELQAEPLVIEIDGKLYITDTFISRCAAANRVSA